jgi:hypothetical protein
MSMIGSYRSLSEKELDALIANPVGLVDFLFNSGDPMGAEGWFDVDKAWHVIHYLLTGESWGGAGPLANAVLGGVPISEEDVGYGPARFIRAAEVAETARALEAISADQLWAKFDAEAMAKAQIYPDLQGDEEDREYVCDHFEHLKKFFATAASRQQAMLLYLC